MKHKKKPTKNQFEIQKIVLTGLVDFVVGMLLIIADKVIG